MTKLSMEKVKESLIEKGLSYISGEYKNLDSLLLVNCPEGHEFQISLKKARQNPRCPSCVIKDSELDLNKEESFVTPPKKKGIRRLGIDNATIRSGYCVKEDNRILAYGAYVVSGTAQERMLKNRQWLISMMDNWKIDYVGLENVQYQGNPQTLITLSKMLGILEIVSLEFNHQETLVFPVGEWRSWCGIKGKGRQQQKEAAQTRVFNLYGLRVSQDTAEAICICDYLEHKTSFQKGWGE